jgi:hypothetical protein
LEMETREVAETLARKLTPRHATARKASVDNKAVLGLRNVRRRVVHESRRPGRKWNTEEVRPYVKCMLLDR